MVNLLIHVALYNFILPLKQFAIQDVNTDISFITVELSNDFYRYYYNNNSYSISRFQVKLFFLNPANVVLVVTNTRHI